MIQANRFVKSLLIIFCLIPAFAFAASAQLTGITISNQNNKDRITFNLVGKANYNYFILTNPNRLVIDFPDSQLSMHLDQISIANTSISQIREGHPSANMLRLVFELNSAKKLTIVPINSTSSHPQLAFDLTDIKVASNTSIIPPTNHEMVNAKNNKMKSAELVSNDNEISANSEDDMQQQLAAEIDASLLPSKQTIAAIKNEASNSKTIVNTDQNLSSNNTVQRSTTELESIINANTAKPVIAAKNTGKQRDIIVVIDPGHGGKDPGTIGSVGIQEKNVVLEISKCLAQEIEKESGFKAVLTRNSDYFIPLRQRLRIAREERGDMFVAIHADAFINPYAGGSSVFALSAHGASSEAARWLAEKENYSELGGVSLLDKSNVLRSVLIDLSQTATISASLQLGNNVLRQLSKIGRLHRGFVEQAPFMVLKSPDIPSLLVETGFLSNPLEEQRLHDPYYQRKIASAIAAGIRNYFMENPPPGTLVATQRKQ